MPSAKWAYPFAHQSCLWSEKGSSLLSLEHVWLHWCFACIRASDYSQFSTKISFFCLFVFEATLKHEVFYSLFQLKLVPSGRAVKIFVLISLFSAALSQILGLWPLFPKMTCMTLVWVAIFSLLFLLLLTWNFHPINELGKGYQGPVFQLSRERALFSAVAAQDRTSATQGYKGVECDEKCQQLAPTGVKEESHTGSGWGRESHLLDCTWPGQNFCNTGLMCVISKSWFTCHRHSLFLLTFSRFSSMHISSFVVWS